MMSMSGYTKLFNSILASTIWLEDDKTRLVWITLLAMANRYGVAEGSIPGIAKMAGVSAEDGAVSIAKLSSPDPASRSKRFAGRRIKEVDGGFLLLNHAKYREFLSADERREYNRLKQAESRLRRRQKASANVNEVIDETQMSAMSAHTAPPSPSPSPSLSHTTRAASRSSAPLITSPREHERLQKNHAYVGSRLRVPRVLHVELRGALGGSTADADLMAWYADLDADLEHSDEAIPDIWAWLRGRFRAWERVTAHAKPAPPAGPKPYSMADTAAEAIRILNAREAAKGTR